MLTPDQALKKILAASSALPPCKLDIRKASGFVLASDVKSRDDLPRFDNSAMDGFAVRAADIRAASEKNPIALRVIGEVHAGSPANPTITRGTAARISTGAKIPKGADAVVMQEDCEIEGRTSFQLVDRQKGQAGGLPYSVLVKCPEPPGSNIRRRGEEIRRGQIALQQGTLLNAGSTAWLATMGVKTISAHRRPRVGVLRSGTEVVDFSRAPRPDQVRDAHGVSLASALEAMGCDYVMPPIVGDEMTETVRAFRKLLVACDLVLTTGGVSVGDRDLFREAARKLGVKEMFHGIAQKPGKPLAFGAHGKKLWFGLPGNPVSALVCFYIYVRPALLKMAGHREVLPQWFEALAAHPMTTDSKKTIFARGTLRDGKVSLAEKQGSHCLGSFAEANVLARIAPSGKKLKEGQKILCMPLPA